MTRTHKKQPRAKVKKAAKVPLLKGPLSRTTRMFGYARVSTVDQNLDVQLAALEAAGVAPEDLFVEKVSAVNAKRPMFNLMMKLLERGDYLLFHALTRIGRDTLQIRNILDQLAAEGVVWRSLTEPHLDMTTAVGRYMVNTTSAHAQYERDQVSERTTRAMQLRKARGMWNGRRAMFTPVQAKQIKRDRKTMSREQTAKKYRCSPGTIDKYAS